MVNSGSSANLLAFFALTNPMKKNRFKIQLIFVTSFKCLVNLSDPIKLK